MGCQLEHALLVAGQGQRQTALVSVCTNEQHLQCTDSVHSHTLLRKRHAKYISTKCIHRVASTINSERYCPLLFKDVDCGMPEDISNGTVTADSTVYDSSAMYTCNSGYVLVGLALRVCEADGSWSNAAPACERK